jgi:membrane protein DedA with SNARE-associated domain
MENLTQSTFAFIQEHGRWGPPIVLALAFCESFAFVSLLVPATGILLGVGGLIAADGLHFWSIWLPAALGAIAGDWLAGLAPISWRGEVTREDFTVFEETTKQ